MVEQFYISGIYVRNISNSIELIVAICCRSFQPILRLVPMNEAPQVQLWAVWALCNLTKVNSKFYVACFNTFFGISIDVFFQTFDAS